MRKIREVSESKMISIFLKTEISSSRWSDHILKLLDRDKKSRSIIDHPNLTNDADNAYRKKLLGDFRGYGRNQDLFTDFPTDIKWFLVKLDKTELEKVKYMKYSYWDELSQHTRLAKIGAETIRKGIVIYDQSNEGFLRAAEAIKQGLKFPELILISKNEKSDIVVLEGHQRITAYFLKPTSISDGLEVVIGYSENMNQWDSY